MIGGRSLARRLALITSLGFGAIWLVAALVMAVVLRSEQEELADLTLRETAVLFQPILAERWMAGHGLGPSGPVRAPDETLAYALLDADGTVLLRSEGAKLVDLPVGPRRRGRFDTATHAFYVTGPDADGRVALFGDPLTERAEAYRDSLFAFLLPMLAILPFAYLLVGWIARTALRPLETLRAEISNRGEGRLDPIDAAGQPEELRAMTATLNGLMIRLDRALQGEKGFTTNAAHELRTPVAVALAQVQRLRADVRSSGAAAGEGNLADPGRVDRIEAALLRMSRLVARLLQLARADAGLGAAAAAQDVAALLVLVLEERLRDPAAAARLVVDAPKVGVPARIDPDAFAILAGNLLDNAFEHAPPEATIHVTLSGDGVLTIANDGSVMTQATVATLVRRFHRGTRSGAGFGIGLHIADTIARQAGGALTLASPAPGCRGGLVATFIPAT